MPMLMGEASAPDRSVLVAEHQVSGRGRLDRQLGVAGRAPG